jgi:Indole-3-glycerol phosphate synthase.
MLEILADSARKRVESNRLRLPLGEIQARIRDSDKERVPFVFENALKRKHGGISFICELKRASPAKGLIDPVFPYVGIAKEYEEAGADAISVLTEPEYFMGDDRYLTEVKRVVGIPVLRKDFIVNRYQIFESRLLGADAVLLICALLDTPTLKSFLETCDELGLSAIVEAHSEQEIGSALEAGARIIGVNNRNLRTLEVDINKAICLRQFVPEHITYVAESGIQSREDVEALERAGADAVLIGETLMKSRDRKAMLAYLKGARAKNPEGDDE